MDDKRALEQGVGEIVPDAPCLDEPLAQFQSAEDDGEGSAIFHEHARSFSSAVYKNTSRHHNVSDPRWVNGIFSLTVWALVPDSPATKAG